MNLKTIYLFLSSRFSLFPITKTLPFDQNKHSLEIQNSLRRSLKMLSNCTIYLARTNHPTFQELDEHDLTHSICSKNFECIFAQNPLFSNKETFPDPLNFRHQRWLYQYHYAPYINVFGVLHHGQVCTVLLTLPGYQAGNEIMQNGSGYLDASMIFNYFSGSSLWTYWKLTYPNYVFAIIDEPSLQKEFESGELHVKLPFLFSSVKLAVMLTSSSDVFVSCFTCRKRVSDPLNSPLTSILKPVNRQFDSLTDFVETWNQLNLRKWHNFEVGWTPLKSDEGHYLETCPMRSILKHGRMEQKSMQNLEFCMKRYILLWKNCTTCELYPIEFGADSKNNLDVVRQMEMEFMAIMNNWDGQEYFVVLGDQESQGEILMDLTKFFKSFKKEFWVVFGITIIYLFTIFQVMKGKPKSGCLFQFTWLAWLISVALEQGGDFKACKRYWRNSLIMLAWMWGTLLFRNFYCFTLYSDLTAHSEPENLPINKYGLVGNTSGEINILLGPYNILNRHLESFNSTDDINNTNKSSKSFSKFLARIKSLARTIDDLGPTLQKILQPYRFKLRCIPLKNKEKGNSVNGPTPICDTTKRFAVFYHGSQPRNLHLLLSALSKKTLYKPMNEPEFHVDPLYYTSRGKYFYTNQFWRGIRTLVETGFEAQFEKWEFLRSRTSTVKHFQRFTEMGYKTANLGSRSDSIYGFVSNYNEKYSKMEMMRGVALQNVSGMEEDEIKAKVEEFKLIYALAIFLNSACALVLMLEMILSRA